jgi:Type III restriction enzyme, res subunit
MNQLMQFGNTPVPAPMPAPAYNHYTYQDDMRNAMNKHIYGLLVSPTGTGKGEVICDHATDTFVNTKSKTIVIQALVAHRVILTIQTQQRIVNFCKRKTGKVPFSRMAIHSGDKCEYEDITISERETILSYPDQQPKSVDGIKEMILKSQGLGQDLLIAITYHSLPKLIKALKELNIHLDVCYLDEIHSLSNNKWFQDCQELHSLSDSMFGFTATPGKALERILTLFGQNNPIYELSIKEACDRALIARPRWLLVEIIGTRESNLANGVITAIETFQTETSTKEFKAVIHCKGKGDILNLGHTNKTGLESKLRSIYPNLMIAEMSSQTKIAGGQVSGGGYINGRYFRNRTKWLEAVSKHNGELIVLHIDICNTGLDIPGFNFGLWTYAPTTESYQIQGNGRSGRLNPIDRKNLETGVIKPGETDKMIKPSNIVGMLCFDESVDDEREKFKSLIMRSREYGFIPEDSILLDRNGVSKVSNLPPREILSTAQRNIAEDVITSIEQEAIRKAAAIKLANRSEFKSLSVKDKLANLKARLK